MKGQYKTPTGELLTVVMFDEHNKMVYVENKIGTNKWYHESDYSTWESLEQHEEVAEVKEDDIEEREGYEISYGEPLKLVSKEKTLKVNKKSKKK